MAANNRLRSLISAAANAVTSDDDAEDFETILSTTRRCFRPNHAIVRGRKPSSEFTKKTFLLRRGNSDYFPIKSESEFLTSAGLGYSSKAAKYSTEWDIEEIENYIYSLYPNFPLSLVGVKLARMDRKKKLQVLTDLSNGEDLKQQLGQSQLIILPNRDLPFSLGTDSTYSAPHEQSPSSTASSSSVQHRRTQIGRVQLRNPSSLPPLDYSSAPSVSVTTLDAVPTISPATTDNYVDIIALDHPVDFQNVEYSAVNNYSLMDLSFNLTDQEMVIEVDRKDVVKQLLDYYEDCSILQKTLKVHFKNEEGDDFGGLTKELFTIFWEGCKDKFFHGETIFVPHLELHRRKNNIEKFATLGKILTHMIAVTQTLPNFIARSTYLLIGNIDFQVPKEIIEEDFMFFLTYGERALLKKALSSFDTLHCCEKTLLEEFFITNHFYDNPKKEELHNQIQTIAESVIISKTIDFVKIIKEGIPMIYEQFWSDLTVDKLNAILVKQLPTPDKVLQCLETDKEDLTVNETSALYYLKTFIMNLTKEELSKFLYFITGSCNMPRSIKISFINLKGTCRRPIVHTCSNVLELPSTYTDSQDLSREFKAILNNDESFQYSQI